jgi:O-antigen/teichoic acid export membrane protein
VSNIIRGGATALVSIGLPHFLAHSLDKDRFAAWSLILQIAAYASIFDFGLQTCVARFVSQANESREADRIPKVVGTALAMLSVGGLVALVITLWIVSDAASFFHGVPMNLLHEFRTATVIMALGAAFLLPLSTFTGVLVGLQRNEVPAFAIGGSRLAGATVAVFAARYTTSLTVIALFVAAPNLAGGLIQALASRKIAGDALKQFWFDREVARSMIHYGMGLTVWSVGMLLVSGLDVTIVAHFQFESVGYYAIAATAITIFASANSSILSALLAPFSAMQTSRNFLRMRDIVLRATRVNTLVNWVLTVFVIEFGERILRLWVGPSYAHLAYPVLVVLMVTQTIRLVANAYSIALMATGHQNSGIPAVVVEATANLAASIWGVIHFGAIGVAIGSLVGALLALPCLFLFTMKVREDLIIHRKDLAIEGMLFGLLPAAPMLAVAILVRQLPMPKGWIAALWSIAILGGTLIFLGIEGTLRKTNRSGARNAVA